MSNNVTVLLCLCSNSDNNLIYPLRETVNNIHSSVSRSASLISFVLLVLFSCEKKEVPSATTTEPVSITAPVTTTVVSTTPVSSTLISATPVSTTPVTTTSISTTTVTPPVTTPPVTLRLFAWLDTDKRGFGLNCLKARCWSYWVFISLPESNYRSTVNLIYAFQPFPKKGG